MRAEALSELTPCLPEIRQEALEATRTLKDEHSKGWSLSNLAQHSSEILLEALAAVRAIEPGRGRVLKLRELAPQLAKLPPDNLYPSWCETLRDLSRDRREDLLRDIQEFSSVINTLGGFKAVAEVARAIQDVGRQWP